MFEKCHGKLLMWDAVACCADVLLGLIEMWKWIRIRRFSCETTPTQKFGSFLVMCVCVCVVRVCVVWCAVVCVWCVCVSTLALSVL